MSNKDLVIQLLEKIPDYKIGFILAYAQGIAVSEIEEVEPDEWDLQMIKQANEENDGTYVTFDELLKKDGLSYNDL